MPVAITLLDHQFNTILYNSTCQELVFWMGEGNRVWFRQCELEVNLGDFLRGAAL
jgi:hypothetical protein